MSHKSQKKKLPVDIKPEVEVTPRSSEPPRKKKNRKTAPDQPQPEWMFPPGKENSVLNPKSKSNPKSEKLRRKEEDAKDQAIKSLKHKPVAAPTKSPPPDLLLTLVGSFLSSYGFDHTSRHYTPELQSRKKLDSWKTEIGVKLPDGFPNLVSIFEEWYQVYQERLRVGKTKSSGSNDSDDTGTKNKTKREKEAKEAKAQAKASEAAATEVNATEATSSSEIGSSDEESDSDAEMKDVTPAKKPTKKLGRTSKATSSSPSSSTSDSDADDEQDNAGAHIFKPAALQKPTINGSLNGLKRKAISSSSSSSESTSDSGSSRSASVQPTLVENGKISSILDAIPDPPKSVGDSKSTPNSSSSNTSSSDSESANEFSKPATITTAVAKVDSESSSESESDEEARRPILATAPTVKAEDSSSSSPSESTSSDSESSEDDSSKPRVPTGTKTGTPAQVSSDSSVTLQASSAQKASVVNTSLSSSSYSNTPTPADQPATTTTNTTTTTTTTGTKRKRSSSPPPKASSKFAKKQNIPFQRVPKDTHVDPKMASNAYRSYDYADRAHQDLSVTRGSLFTKAKNKKKRGTYRGGAIDVNGGKGVKFED